MRLLDTSACENTGSHSGSICIFCNALSELSERARRFSDLPTLPHVCMQDTPPARTVQQTMAPLRAENKRLQERLAAVEEVRAQCTWPR